MKYTVPDYFKEFKCIASACPDTCCAGWQIMIDPASLKRYREYPGSFGNRLRNSIDWEEGCFQQYEKRCAFLNEENLCDIYSEAGPEYLCKTCRRYPRHIEEFENERELSLSVSCPVVAELLLSKQEKTVFLEKMDERQEKEYEDFDFFLYSALQDSRKVIIDILQDRTLSIAFRAAKVLCLAHDIQNRIQAGQIFDIQNVAERYQREGADQALSALIEKEVAQNKEADINKLFLLLEQLEVLHASWPECVKRWKHNVTSERIFQQKSGLSDVQKEQILVYFIYTYYCGSVYDGDMFAKVKMALVFVLLADLMIRAELAAKEQDPEVSNFAVMTDIVRRFSRELEHSDDNLNKMEQMMNQEENVSFTNMLHYVWQEI